MLSWVWHEIQIINTSNQLYWEPVNRGKVKENHLTFLYLIVITENIWNLKQTYLSCYVAMAQYAVGIPSLGHCSGNVAV